MYVYDANIGDYRWEDDPQETYTQPAAPDPPSPGESGYSGVAGPTGVDAWRWVLQTPSQAPRPGHQWIWGGGWDENGQGWQETPIGGFNNPVDSRIHDAANVTNDTNDYGLNYWEARGYKSNDLFDLSTGQLRPGWRHTARGYENDSLGTGNFEPDVRTGPGPGPGGPRPGGGGGVAGGSYGGGYSPSFGGGSMAGNVTNAPAFVAPRYKSPGAFKDHFKQPDPFVAPDKEQVLADDGYQVRLAQGERAIKNAASAAKMSRTGPTWKGLIDYGQGMASQEYGQVYGRRASEYDRNYENSFKTAATNYGFLFDEADREYRNAFSSASAEYQPQFSTWEAQTGRDWQNEMLSWQKEQFGSDSAFRDKQFGADSAFRNDSLAASILSTIFSAGRRN